MTEKTTETPLTDSVKEAIHDLFNCVQEISMELHLAERGHTRKAFNYMDLLSAVGLINHSLEDLRAAIANLEERLAALKVGQ